MCAERTGCRWRGDSAVNMSDGRADIDVHMSAMLGRLPHFKKHDILLKTEDLYI
jgi:hypothetical protein